MNNRNYTIKSNDKNKINKECCLVCSIIISFHLSYLGIILYIFQNNDWDNSTS